ncbi:MAG: glycosyl hydrolase, partial [Anaerolineales bacterium]
LDKCLHCGRPVPIDFRPLGSGYDYDYIDANSIINRMMVDPETGQLVVGDMKYRLMVLPKHDHINLDVLQKIRTLVKQGATILGPVQPIRTNSLTDYPAADREAARIGTELWGAEKSREFTAPSSHKFGKGIVFIDMTVRQVLTQMGIKPDFTVLEGGSQEGPDRVDYIHRRTDNADIYFVCNGAAEAKSLHCQFRDAEGRPEIWYPVTGEIRLAKAISRQPDNSCNIELELPAIGSAFIIFRRDGQAPEETAKLFGDTSEKGTPIDGIWTVKFQPGRLAPESVEWNELIDWTNSEEPGIRYFSGTAAYSIQFEMPVATSGDFWLDLGKVCEVGEVSIDGQDLGTAWTFPFRVKVPAKLLGKGSHLLEVKVTNVWNNRLVGDQFLPEGEGITRTNLQGQHTKDSPLVPSGLIGPVTLQLVFVSQEIDDLRKNYE